MTDYCESGCDILAEDLLHVMPGVRVVAGARVALLLASLPLLAWLVLSDTVPMQVTLSGDPISILGYSRNYFYWAATSVPADIIWSAAENR